MTHHRSRGKSGPRDTILDPALNPYRSAGIARRVEGMSPDAPASPRPAEYGDVNVVRLHDVRVTHRRERRMKYRVPAFQAGSDRQAMPAHMNLHRP